MLTDLLSPAVLAFSFAVTLAGGFVKGAVGFAMPLIMVSGMSMVMEPRLAVAGLVIPTVASNLLQVARAGRSEALAAARDFWLYILVACTMVFVVAQFLVQISAEAAYLAIGLPVFGLSVVQLIGWRPTVAPTSRAWADPAVGLVTGTIGGVAGNWGPPTVLYLLALGVGRTRQMAVQGVVYAMGAITLLAGHLRSGVLNAETVPLSAILLVPAFLGMWAGFRFGDRLDPRRFRRWTLAVLLVAGLNLIRRGLLG
ncbi:sulfite exporter TauE/SafE family protein [Palleronia rufa]|uniref:sulfite exporter TauE/SafE family protein n=1 Tax=Palleronia rufa TaxID=1530186 RepID=UPI0005607F94|nr:sulfite exporter TauE/SafE family protein [Palleronia rufa]